MDKDYHVQMGGCTDPAVVASLEQELQHSDEGIISSTSLELLEQHQVKEQARLLQRFWELREWQQQQQQQLMQQQQLQLRTLQDEQSKVQNFIATQKGGPWNQVLRSTGGRSKSPLMTPPSKPHLAQANHQKDMNVASHSHGAGISMDSGLVSMQDTLKSQSSLPVPMMYVDPATLQSNHNEDDKYTSSELFSNPGSLEDQMEIVKSDLARCSPDRMSDTSENFIHSKLPPPRWNERGKNGGSGDNHHHLAGLDKLLSTAPAGLLQQVLNMMPINARATAPANYDANEVELSASPTLPGPRQQQPTRKSQVQEQRHHHQWQNQQQSLHKHQNHVPAPKQHLHSHPALRNQALDLGPAPILELDSDPKLVPRAVALTDDNMDDDDHDDEGWQDEVDEEDEDEGISASDDDNSDEDSSEQNITAKEVSETQIDDRPIQGTGGKKSFEQLLEEKLMQEEQEKLRSQEQKSEGRKQAFLKKGEGISRFSSAPKKPVKKPPVSKTNRRSSGNGDGGRFSSQSGNGHLQGQDSKDSSKNSVGLRLKSMSKGSNNAPLARKVVKNVSNPDVPQAKEVDPTEPVGNLALIRSAASRKLEVQRALQSDITTAKLQHFVNLPRKDSIPAEREKTPSRGSRSGGSEDHDSTEMDSLAEFELLEDAMDNMSFCSNSSILRKFVADDKQAHKEAISRLKTISGSRKTGVVERPLEEAEGDVEDNSDKISLPVPSLAHGDVGEDQPENRSSYKSSIGNSSGANGVGRCGGNIHIVTPGSSDSSSATLTDSSEEEEGEDDDYNHPGNEQKGLPNVMGRLGEDVTVDRYSDSSSYNLACKSESSNPTTAAATTITTTTQSVQPNSSKVMTRKVAPISGKFTAAKDTLSMLKTLSQQASFLTAHAAPDLNYTTAYNNNLSNNNSNNNNHNNNINSNPGVGQAFHHNDGLDTYLHPTTSDALLCPAPTDTVGESLSGTAENITKDTQPLIPTSQSSSWPTFPSKSPRDFLCSDTGSLKFSNGLVRKSQEKSYNSQRYGVGVDSDNDDSSSDESEERTNQQKDQRHDLNNEGSRQTSTDLDQFNDHSEWVDDDDDDDEDDENQTCLKSGAGAGTGAPARNADNVPESTPPTSRLVARLFPKLKPKPNLEAEKASQALRQASSQPIQAQVDGVQSKILRDKLAELDVEIERFRSENANLEKLRREREEGVTKLKQEIGTFQAEKEQELLRLEEFRAEEMKKLKRERKLFDSYQKKVRSMPDKKEREEIETMRNQLKDVQDELKRKESRWNASTARLKNRLAEVELENGELKEEVRILEKKRLEWMTAQASAKKPGVSNGKAVAMAYENSDFNANNKLAKAGSSFPRSSTPTGEMVDSDEATHRVQSGTRTPGGLGNRDHHSGTKSFMPGKAVAPPAAATTSSATASKVASSTNNGLRSALPMMTSNPKNSRPAAANIASGKGLSVVKQPVPPTVHSSLSGEGMQKSMIPVMMENTLPSGVPEGSLPGAVSSLKAPQDKSAARMALERAVVDRGEEAACTETVHGDGKVEKTYKTGAKEIHFPNGTVKEISADGQTIVCRLTNGDIRQIFPDHRVVYVFAEAEIMQTTFPDGLETFQFSNGQTERRYPDGTVEITFPSKDVKYLFPDGGQEVILTDGTVMQYNSQGERTVEYPSGDREVHTAEYQRREFPDGIIKTVFSDGRHETRFPNGRVRMRDKAGNVIMDEIVYS